MADDKVTIWQCPFLGEVVSRERGDGTVDVTVQIVPRVRAALQRTSALHELEGRPPEVLQDLVLDYVADGAPDDHVNSGATTEERCLRLIARWEAAQAPIAIN